MGKLGYEKLPPPQGEGGGPPPSPPSFRLENSGGDFFQISQNHKSAQFERWFGLIFFWKITFFSKYAKCMKNEVFWGFATPHLIRLVALIICGTDICLEDACIPFSEAFSFGDQSLLGGGGGGQGPSAYNPKFQYIYNDLVSAYET